MATASKVLAYERKFVRTAPYGDSNIFNKHNGQPWCGSFQKYCFTKMGMGDWIGSCSNPDYCPTLESWAKSNDTWKLRGESGDLVLFDWNGNKAPDHVGIVLRRNANGSYTTIEGNTSNASNGNGGCVQIRVREARWVLGFIRPPYSRTASIKKTATVAKAKSGKTYSGTFPKLIKHTDGTYLTLGDSGSGVKSLQKFLNWYLGYDLKVDGKFGELTRRGVKAWQKSQGISQTGDFGEVSLSHAKLATK